MSFPVNSSLPRCFKYSWGEGWGGRCCRGKGQRSPPAPRPCRGRRWEGWRERGFCRSLSRRPGHDGHRLPHLQLISPSPAGPDRRGALGGSHKRWLSLGERCEPDLPWPCSPQPGLTEQFGLKGAFKCQPGQFPRPAPAVPLRTSAHHPKDDALDVPAPLRLSPRRLHAALAAQSRVNLPSGLLWGVSKHQRLNCGCRSHLTGLLSSGTHQWLRVWNGTTAWVWRGWQHHGPQRAFIS